MARIFYGNLDMIDQEVLEAVKSLPDEFYVLTEFDLNRRNVDWLIIRPVPDYRPASQYSTVILTELKRTSAPFRGGEMGRWEQQRNGIWEELVPTNMSDENPWRQLINTVNAVRNWLYNNQRRFVALDRPEYQEQVVRIWPNLLILGDPPDMVHRLPLQPQTRFGAFHYDLPLWLDKIRHWNPNVGLQLTAAEVEALVEALGLRSLYQPAPPAEEPQDAPDPEPDDTAADEGLTAPGPNGDLDWLQGFALWASGVEERLRRIEEHLAAPRRPAAPRPVAVERPLADAERACIATALGTLRFMHKGRTFANLFSEMHRITGGDSFKLRNFNGYGSARAMIDQAVKEGLVRYGPPDQTGTPTVYFPDEPMPGAA